VRSWLLALSPQPRQRIAPQQIQEHPLRPGTMTAMLAIIAATPAGLAQLYPIRRPVAGAGILRPIHECLYQYRRNPVPDLPIPGQMPQCACQRGTRQIFYLYPGQQDKPAVIDKQRQMTVSDT
jgi:hypothetical protein